MPADTRLGIFRKLLHGNLHRVCLLNRLPSNSGNPRDMHSMSTVYGLGRAGNDRRPPNSGVADGFREVRRAIETSGHIA
jgi:hypothetical protein